MKVSAIPVLAVTLCTATMAQAHPGHGSSGNGLSHYLTEQQHLLGLLLLMVGVVALGYALRRLSRHSRQVE